MTLSAVHEAIGYLMVLATSSPKYLHEVGLIDEVSDEKGKEYSTVLHLSPFIKCKCPFD